MNIINKYNLVGIKPDLYTNTELQLNNFAQELNCVRVGIVQEFLSDRQLVRVKIASQRLIKTNPDGTQTTQDYAEIYAKLCYASPYVTFPPQVGDECVLLFNDREMESWWINGSANQQAYDRMHDLTDCIAICGLRSQPKLIEIPTDTLRFFYFGNDMSFTTTEDSKSITITTESFNLNDTSTTITSSDAVSITSKTTSISADDSSISMQSGSITVTSTAINLSGNVTANHLVVSDGATGTFISQDNKTITVTNGIVMSITQ